jgi:hypothetical protein
LENGSITLASPQAAHRSVVSVCAEQFPIVCHRAVHLLGSSSGCFLPVSAFGLLFTKRVLLISIRLTIRLSVCLTQ